MAIGATVGNRLTVPGHRPPTPHVAFSGDWFFLSNFYPHPFHFDGRLYPTAEHAFQAAECSDEDEAERVRQARSPVAAKQLGSGVRLRVDWDEAHVDVMRAVLAAKFSDPDLRARLIATGGAELVEENTWGDRFWGRSRGGGRNMLGDLLMELRESLRA
jgi:N-glycosidase YbiA